MTRFRRQPELRGIPCSVCGSTTSAADWYPGARGGYRVLCGGYRVLCVTNADGRDRCRERERAVVFDGAPDRRPAP